MTYPPNTLPYILTSLQQTNTQHRKKDLNALDVLFGLSGPRIEPFLPDGEEEPVRENATHYDHHARIAPHCHVPHKLEGQLGKHY